MAKPAERIIEKFGGQAATQKALGHKNPTTVQGWRERGFIPGNKHAEVYEAAKLLGIELRAEDFVEFAA